MGAAIAKFVVWIGGGFLTQILFVLSAKGIRTVGAWATILALLAALYAVVNIILTGLYYAMPTYIATASTWIVPSNIDECLTGYLTFSAAVTLFKMKRRGIQMALGF